MSQDIRSFFTKATKRSSNDPEKSKPSKKRAIALSSDEETIPSTPSPKGLKVQKKRRILDKSDEGDSQKAKKAKSIEAITVPVNAADIFGSEPVKRTESKVKTKNKINKAAEAEVHLDPDFIKTLEQLDDLEVFEGQNIESKRNNEFTNKINTQIKKSDDIVVTKKNSENITNPMKNTPKKNDEKEKAVTNLNSSKKNISQPKNSPNEKNVSRFDSSFNQSFDNDIDPDEERFEKRRQSAALYQKFLKRSGPKNPGSKEIPKGKPGCLSGLVFVITGVLDSLERDEAAQIIKDYGGRVPGQISGKVTHLVLGEDAGPAKVAKAESMNIKIINEDDLLDLIRQKSGLVKANLKPENASDEINFNKNSFKEIKKEKSEHKNLKNDTIKNREEKVKLKHSNTGKENLNDIKHEKISPIKKIKKEINEPSYNKKDIKIETIVKDEKTFRMLDEHYNNIHSIENLAWVDKYKPTSCKQIIGQQGAGSNSAKLMNWLSKWYSNHNGKTKLVKPSPWAKNDDGAYFKAALLSGPPGVGKTTTATLVCKELGFDAVEFNASDTRSKKLLKDEISELLSNKSLFGYFNGGNEATSKKHVLIMDEVDGMAGNEDRGGLQELIGLIKNSSVPIICMCNDRNHQKMRTLVNYCYDLRFCKPRVEQIRGALMSICYKEGIKINPDALSEIIMGANQDIRQILNHLSMWSSDNKNISINTASKEADLAKKDLKIGPWEVVRKIFSKEEHKKMTIFDKSDLFFQDYSLIPLFVQQNYLIVQPSCQKHEVLKRIALTADSLSLGDLVDRHIRSNMAWSLLPTQAMFSSVLPGDYMSGHVAGQINFPAWLGKNSKRNKLLRMSAEVFSHIRSRTTASKNSVRLDYAKPLLESITRPLIKEGNNGVPTSLNILKDYQLLREDIENLQEFNNWPGSKDPLSAVDGKVKASLTRALNKELATFTQSTAKKKNIDTDENPYVENEDTVPSEDEQEKDDIENDALIKAKKKTSTKTVTATNSKGSIRGRGRGKGK